MRYRLGELIQESMAPGGEGTLPRLLEAFRERRHRVLDSAFLRSVREAIQRESDEARSAPDLLQELSFDSPDRRWVEEAASEIRALRSRGRSPALVVCEGEEGPGGYLAIGAYDGSESRPVRTGDLVNAGFLATRTDEGISVYPRIFRKVCSNGAVVFSHTGEQVQATPETLSTAIETCLAPSSFSSAVARLQQAAKARVADPLALLRQARASSEEAEVVELWRSEGDPTAWGLINAVTASARRERRLPRRIQLERDAERILQAIETRVRAEATLFAGSTA
jgi:hypothetical protein